VGSGALRRYRARCGGDAMIPTDTEGLLRDAGGARPASDVDALIERLQGFNPPDRTIASQRDYSQAIHDAAAALVQLREEISARSDLMQGYLDCWRKSEAAYERLQSSAYERLQSSAIAGEKGLKVLQARIAALEAERDAMRDLLRRLRQWDMLSEGNTPRLADRDYWCEQIDAAIDAAREQK